MITKWFKNIGPGPLVAAAFIGPGTVTLCTLAGVNFGYNLLWAMVLSVVATIVLQEMAARIGIVSQKGLSEVIRQELKHPIARTIIVVLILSAIVVGNSAYEAGNISGGALGLETIFDSSRVSILGKDLKVMPLIIGFSAFLLLYYGNYKVLEKSLVVLVIVMSLAFLITAVITKPSIVEVLSGLIPRTPEKSILTIVGLIGTTVVPYNLFLHASLAKTKWKQKEDLKLAKKDTFVAVVLGGLVSMCIIISASAVANQDISNAADLAKSLEPLFGIYASMF